MTSYCDVVNPTKHLEPNLESCKVGLYEWRMYDEVVSSSDEKETKEDNVVSRAKTAGVL